MPEDKKPTKKPDSGTNEPSGTDLDPATNLGSTPGVRGTGKGYVLEHGIDASSQPKPPTTGGAKRTGRGNQGKKNSS